MAGWVCWWDGRRLHSGLGFRVSQVVVVDALVVVV